jgi:hypothetical protein
MKEKLKILAAPANEGGCAYYRIICPVKKLEQLYGDRVEVRWNKNPLGIDESNGRWKKDWDFEDMKWADIVFTQNLSNFGGNYTARIVGKANEFGTDCMMCTKRRVWKKSPSSSTTTLIL